MLHSRLLIYLDEVVRQGSIRKAAEILHISPSAVSRQILSLEKDIGTPLFDRTDRRLKPTAAGELLVKHARETIKELAHARSQIEQLKGLRRGVVNVGLMSGLAANILPRAVIAFHERNPRVELNLRLMSTGRHIVSAIESGEIDLGFGFDFDLPVGVRLLHSARARLGAVMSVGHPLAGAAVLRLSDCSGYPLVLADETMAIRPYIKRALDYSSLRAMAIAETNSIEVMRGLAMASQCIAFLTPFDVEAEMRAGRLVYVPVKELATHTQQMMLVERSRRSNVLAHLFSEAIKSCTVEAETITRSVAQE